MDNMKTVLVVFVVVLASLHSASTFPSQDEQDEFQADQPKWRRPFNSNMSPCECIHNILDSEDHKLTYEQVQMVYAVLDIICGNATEEMRWFGFHRPPNPLTTLCSRLSSFLTYAAGLKVPLDNNLASANTSQLLVTALSEMCRTSRAIFGRQEEPDELLESTPFPPPRMASKTPPPKGSGPPPPPPDGPDGPLPQPPMVDEDMSPRPPPTGTPKPEFIEPRK